jgi:hypothetical protein
MKYDVIQAFGDTSQDAAVKITLEIELYRARIPSAQTINISATVCCPLSEAAGGAAAAGMAKNFWIFALMMIP